MSMALAFPIRVPSDLLEELGAFTGKFWSSLDLEPIICDAIPPLATSNSPTLGRVKFPQAGQSDCSLIDRSRVVF